MRPQNAPSRRGRVWRWVRRAWVTLGIGFTVILVGWSYRAFQASGSARGALIGDEAVRVERSGGMWRFTPQVDSDPDRVGLLFFPGGMVEPEAYAPLVRATAEAGFESVIMEMPMRGAFGGADSPELYASARGLLADPAPPDVWVVGGHSRGAVVAAEFAARSVPGMGALLLIGTTHPRDVDLSTLPIPVVKLAGTRDGLARPDAVRGNAHLLPQATEWLWIEGGNHSQFAWYGFQPLDRRAGISRSEQQRIMIDTVTGLLQSTERGMN